MEEVWNTFTELFKTVNAQARLVAELEARVEALEARLGGRVKALEKRPAKRDAAPPYYPPRRERPELDGRERFPAREGREAVGA